jgi:hypothetical protein
LDYCGWWTALSESALTCMLRRSGSAARLNEGDRCAHATLPHWAALTFPHPRLISLTGAELSGQLTHVWVLRRVAKTLAGGMVWFGLACRRILCFRYLPKETSTNRWGYLPSDELMAKLTPRQRSILTER